LSKVNIANPRLKAKAESLDTSHAYEDVDICMIVYLLYLAWVDSSSWRGASLYVVSHPMHPSNHAYANLPSFSKHRYAPLTALLSCMLNAKKTYICRSIEFFVDLLLVLRLLGRPPFIDLDGRCQWKSGSALAACVVVVPVIIDRCADSAVPRRSIRPMGIRACSHRRSRDFANGVAAADLATDM
jgi:hypothetical protein